MKKLYSLLLLMLCSAILVQAQEWVFARQFSSTGAVDPVDSKLDANGNIYLVGNYVNALTIGALSPLTYAGSNEDIYLCKFSSNGTAIWARRLGGTNKELVGGLAIDVDNNVYVTGGFRSTPMSFEGGSTTLYSQNNYDAFLAKYDGDGNLIFADSIFWGSGPQRMNDITYDYTNDYLVVAGIYQTEIRYDSAGTEKVRTTTYPKDLVIARFDTDGNFVDLADHKSNIQQSAFKNVNLSVISGAVTGYFVTGDLKGQFLSPGGTELFTAPDVTNMDIMVIKFDQDLNYVWGRTGGGTDFDHINSSGSDGYGNVYFTGKSGSSSMTVDSTETLTSAPRPTLGIIDYIVGKYNRNGNLQFLRRVGGIGNDNAYGLAVRGKRILYTGIVDIGGNVQTGFAAYDIDGNLVAEDTIKGDGTETGLNVAFSLSGDSVFVTGNFDGDSLTAGPYRLDNTAPGVTDGFFVKYGFNFNLYEASRQNILCYGESTGSITVGTEFGTLPINYAWTPDVSSTNTATNLTAGSYKIVATDDDGRKDSIEITLTQPPDLVTSLTLMTPTSCNTLATSGNKSDGALDITVTGGLGPYVYSWSPTGKITQDITGVGAGMHIISVTDANGCTEVDTFNITQPDAITHGGSIVDTIKIPPGSNGAVRLNTVGGTPGYSFSWTGPPGFIPSTDDTIKNLLYGGNYELGVTDAKGCLFDTTFNVPVDSGLNAVICEQSDVTCWGDEDGHLKVCVTFGGSGAYSYAWRTCGGTPVGLNNAELIAGKGCYICKVTDLISLKFTEVSGMINEPATPLNLGVDSIWNVSCPGKKDGAIFISINGGWGGNTYLWTPSNKISQNLIGVGANTYSVTVTNSGGCVKALSDLVIGSEDPISVNVSEYKPISCNGMGNGELLAHAQGGTKPYSYVWSDLGHQNDSIATGLNADSYTVEVIGARGCTGNGGKTLSEPDALDIMTDKTDPTYCVLDNGSITVLGTGGTRPCMYALNGGAFQPDSVFTGLSVGTDTVWLDDAGGCGPISAIVTLTAPCPDPISIDSTIMDVMCHGESTGSICVTPSGGVGAYYYSWTGYVVTDSCLTDVPAGSYEVTISDHVSDTLTTMLTVAEPDALTASVTPIMLECNGDNTGKIDITSPAGGTAGYEFSIDGGSSWQASGNFSGLAAGTYSVWMRDDAVTTCMGTLDAALDVTEPDALEFTMIDTSGNSIVITVEGGTRPYAYYLDNQQQADSVIAGLTTGSYTVRADDANGCSTGDSTVMVTEIGSIFGFSGIRLYPNPTTGKITIEMENERGEDIMLELVNMTGRVVYKKLYQYNGNSRFMEVIDLGSQAKGTYFMRVNGLPVRATLMIQ
jgi:hypothetical protein